MSNTKKLVLELAMSTASLALLALIAYLVTAPSVAII